MAGASNAFLQRSLTLRHLRLLIALDDLRQVGRVAELLHISQPAVSKALAEIEAGVGVPLFERTPRGLVPTAQGACLVRHAQIVTNEVAKAGEELAGIARGMATRVSVGAMHGSTGGVLPGAIRLCRQRQPGLVVGVVEGPIDQLLQQLRSGRVDLVVGALIERAVPAGLTFTPLYNEPLTVVCGVKHPLARAAQPTWPALVSQPWVLPTRNARARAVIEAMWRRMGLPLPEVVAETVSLDLTLELVQHASALALVAQRTARKFVAAGLLATLNAPPPGIVMPIGALRIGDAPLSSALSTLEACLIEVAAQG